MIHTESDRTPERVTQHPTANEQLLYFTSTSLASDDRRLVFMSDRTGHPNLFDRDLVTGAERQLTHNAEGHLKSYVYFNGEPYRGFGRASVSLHAPSGTVYYMQGREIRRVDADGRERVLAEYPHGQMTAFTHVSSDGRRLCVPTTDFRALDVGDGRTPAWDIDGRVRAEGLSSWLRVYDTESGAEVVCERVPQCWITHVQFSPIDHNLILYNHEWCSVDKGIRRMWLFDGSRHIRLRTEGDGRNRNDYACHEMWERDGSAIIYHGRLPGRGPCIGRVTPDGRDIREIVLTQGCDRYGHFTSGAPGVLVSDGYYETEGDRQTIAFGNTLNGDWISRVDVDWEQGTFEWTPLCRSDSSWAWQDEHPHPIIDHGSRFVYFTSDRDGRRAVYRIPLNKDND
jgi:Tol biopolymer transport system component